MKLGKGLNLAFVARCLVLRVVAGRLGGSDVFVWGGDRFVR